MFHAPKHHSPIQLVDLMLVRMIAQALKRRDQMGEAIRDRSRVRDGEGMASQVGLTVLGRPGSAFGHEVRHIIAARDEARGELIG